MDVAVGILGGLGLFLYGMNLMGEGLQKSAGDRLKKIVELLTSNIIIGVLVGTVVTAIIQSSSATTVMIVGFVNAGIMSLTQAIGVIMGANIGTTVTAQLVSFNLEGIAPISIGIGIILYLFSSKAQVKNIAEILLGFGILFTGMEFMKDAVKPLAEYKGFTDALVSFGHRPILGLLLGFGITAVVQSSSASMGMLIALAAQGLIPLDSALPILYGQNIGTCVTSLISSIGANRNAKRSAVMHLFFNIIGTMVFLILLNRPIVALVTRLNPNDVARQIANTHTLFNVISVLILLPFAKYLVKLAIKLVPDNNDEDNKFTLYIDERMLETPSIAVGNTVKEVLRMGEIAKECLEKSINGFLKKSDGDIKSTFKLEKKINELQKDLLNYLLMLSKTHLPDDLREEVDNLFNIINDIERIGDHAENIAELASEFSSQSASMSDEGISEITKMYKKVLQNYENALKVIETRDQAIANKVIIDEEEVDKMEKSIRVNHINRLNSNLCSIDAGIVYLDLISNLERISDHCENISKKFISNE